MFWNSSPTASWNEGTIRGGGSAVGGVVGIGGGGRPARQAQVEPYSLAHLRALFQRLIDAQEGRGDAGGETTVIETLRAISEVVVYGENQDAKIAAKAAAKSEARPEEPAVVVSTKSSGADGSGRRAGKWPVDVRREDAFFELFCEKNMMSRFLDILDSPPSRYANHSANSQTHAWGTNGGLDAVVRALTWGGGVLGMGPGVAMGHRGGGDQLRLPQMPGALTQGTWSSGLRSSPQVQVQIIQTTSILVMNVKSDTSLFYLLSNNHVNDMIMFDFRLDDEEVLSHFASFLKTLSLRLNPNTVQFFLRGPRKQVCFLSETPVDGSGSSPGEKCQSGQRVTVGRGSPTGPAGPKEAGETRAGTTEIDQEEASFPLYTRALEYICHGDFHVRIAALTVVLNIYNQRDPLVRAYLNGPAARSASLPETLVGALRSQCLILADRAMAAGVGGERRLSWEGGPSAGVGGAGRSNSGGSSTASAAVTMKTTAAAAAIDPTIWRDSIAGLQDQVFYLEDVFASGQQELNAQLCDALVERFVRPLLLGDWLSGRAGAMFPQVALCALAQLFIVVTHPPLVRQLARETLGNDTLKETENVPPLLALLQGEPEDLCLGALLVLQALVQNRVVRTDLGLVLPAGDKDGVGDTYVGDAATPLAGSEVRNSDLDSGPPLEQEILEGAVDALCHLLAPFETTAGEDQGESGTASPVAFSEVARISAGWGGVARSPGDVDKEDAEEDEEDEDSSTSSEDGWTPPKAGSVEGRKFASFGSGGSWRGRDGSSDNDTTRRSSTSSRLYSPRRHHLVLRLCGKVLASLARPTGASVSDSDSASEVPTRFSSEGTNDRVEESAAGGVRDGNPTAEAGAGTREDEPLNRSLRDYAQGEAQDQDQDQRRRDKVLQRVGEALSAAARAVMSWMDDPEGGSIVAFEEESSIRMRQVQEWSKRVGVDSAITNLPKMSSLILRWSLDTNSAPAPPPPLPPPPPPVSSIPSTPVNARVAARVSEGGLGYGEGGGRARQRGLRRCLQAFLEIRHVWRVLAGYGETDPALLALAGLGVGSGKDQPREGDFLDLSGRECLACHVISQLPPGLHAGGGGEGRVKGPKGTERRIGFTSTPRSRRGRSEIYLVLDFKAFLLATPDRHRLTNGEVKSSAPLMHLASSPDPDDTTRLDIRALSPHPVALMHPVIPPPRPPPPGTTPGSGRDEGKKGRTSFDRSDGVGSNCGAGTHGRGRRSSGLGLDRGAGDAASMCDMQAWACQLVFENSRGCRLARKHMEGRRLRLRSEKMQGIMELLEACMTGGRL